jgi:hypothetical protein
VARVSCGAVYGVNPPHGPHHIFIEHTNGLPHRRPIGALNRLGSNPYGP